MALLAQVENFTGFIRFYVQDYDYKDVPAADPDPPSEKNWGTLDIIAQPNATCTDIEYDLWNDIVYVDCVNYNDNATHFVDYFIVPVDVSNPKNPIKGIVTHVSNVFGREFSLGITKHFLRMLEARG